MCPTLISRNLCLEWRGDHFIYFTCPGQEKRRGGRQRGVRKGKEARRMGRRETRDWDPAYWWNLRRGAKISQSKLSHFCQASISLPFHFDRETERKLTWSHRGDFLTFETRRPLSLSTATALNLKSLIDLGTIKTSVNVGSGTIWQVTVREMSSLWEIFPHLLLSLQSTWFVQKK